MIKIVGYLWIILMVALSNGALAEEASLPPVLTPTPLSPSQQQRLNEAREGVAVDDAAFYALLENAASWSMVAQAGAMIPDYNQIRSSVKTALAKGEAPEVRGQLYLIEGTLAYVYPPKKMERSAFNGTRSFVVYVGNESKLHLRRPEDMVIVHLTNPPALNPTGRPDDFNELESSVRLVGRFYKTEKRLAGLDATRDRHEVSYLMFVGKSMKLDKPSVTEQPGLWRLALMVGVLSVLIIFFAMRALRLSRNRDRYQGKSLRSYLAEKQMKRELHLTDDAQVDQADAEEEVVDLPESADEALAVLAGKSDQ